MSVICLTTQYDEYYGKKKKITNNFSRMHDNTNVKKTLRNMVAYPGLIYTTIHTSSTRKVESAMAMAMLLLVITSRASYF